VCHVMALSAKPAGMHPVNSEHCAINSAHKCQTIVCPLNVMRGVNVKNKRMTKVSFKGRSIDLTIQIYNILEDRFNSFENFLIHNTMFK